jgi:hypothetical protein
VLFVYRTFVQVFSPALTVLLCMALLLSACGAEAKPDHAKRPGVEAPGGSGSAPGQQPDPEPTPEPAPEPTPEPTPEPGVLPDRISISATDLFVAPAVGSLPITLHPAAQVANGAEVLVEAVIPLPRGMLSDITALKVVNADGVELASRSAVLLSWHDAGNGLQPGIRAARVQFLQRFTSTTPLTLSLVIGAARSQNLQTTLTAQSIPVSQSEFFPLEYSTDSNIVEPAVYVTLPADWLGASLLRTRSNPLNPNGRWSLIEQSLPEFARTAVNDVPDYVTEANRINYQTDYEPWLFDRASTLWTVYIRTGEVKWLRHAWRATQFYRNRVSTGYFDMRPDDLKYAYNLPLLIGYALTGDESLMAPIRAVANAAANNWFQPVYRITTNFWTERHLAYSAMASLVAWEATGEVGYLQRVNDIIAGNQMYFDDVSNGWSGGCVLHTVVQHEGGGVDSDRTICSAWMGALYGEVLWRHYLVTGAGEGLQQLAQYGDFLVEQATYVSTETNVNLNGRVFPYYLKGPLYDSKSYGVDDEWGDREHACDVAGFSYRSAYARQLLGQSGVAQVQLADQLMDTCLWNMSQWIRTGQETIDAGKTAYRLAPPRKFNWWFGSTSDLAWLAETAR